MADQMGEMERWVRDPANLKLPSPGTEGEAAAHTHCEDSCKVIAKAREIDTKRAEAEARIVALEAILDAALRTEPRYDSRVGESFCGGCGTYVGDDGTLSHNNDCWVLEARSLTPTEPTREDG